MGTAGVADLDVSRLRRSRRRVIVSRFADLASTFLLMVVTPLILIAIGVPLVWLVRSAARLLSLF